MISRQLSRYEKNSISYICTNSKIFAPQAHLNLFKYQIVFMYTYFCPILHAILAMFVCVQWNSSPQNFHSKT